MIFITGTGRCGTSLLAEFCFRMGFNSIGGDWREELNAGRECSEVVSINNQIAKQGITDELAEAIRSYSLPIAKDPRFVSLATLKHWLTIRKDMRFILCYRECRAVVDSTRSKLWVNREDRSLSPSDHAGKFRSQLELFANLCRENNIPVKVLRYPQMVTAYHDVYRVLRDFAGLEFDRDKGRSTWQQLAKRSMCHYRSDEDHFYPHLLSLLPSA